MHSIRKIENLIARGEDLEAYDSAAEFLQEKGSTRKEILTAKHLAILSLVRSGAIEQASLEYRRLELDQVNNHEDILALGGKLLKGEALEAIDAKRQNLASKAAEKYRQAYEQTGGYYSAINWATLSLLAGDKELSKKLAQDILGLLSNQPDDRLGEEGYYLGATRAEAHLLQGDQIGAEEALATAITLDPENFAARATTLQQFEVILHELKHSTKWLNAYRPPRVAHFAGHLYVLDKKNSTSCADTIKGLNESIEEALEHEQIGSAFGALAAGSDIMIAEGLIAKGGEFHLVLPVPVDAFVRISVAPFGEPWISRFEACKAQAKSIHCATENLDYLDNPVISFGNQIAMGLAVLKAKNLATEAVQFLVWDGKGKKETGTRQCADFWKETGRKQINLPFPESLRLTNPLPVASQVDIEKTRERRLMAMLFADFHGYGSLHESQIPVFVDSVLGCLADSCNKMSPPPAFCNTWGDGLFLAFEEILDATRMAIELQNSFKTINLKDLDLPENLTLRIGGHYGPVHEGDDPYLKRRNIFGTEITFAARIEPATPPGSIFVSEHFASILASTETELFHCEYAGRRALAKNGPKIPLFSLRAQKLAGKK